MKKDSLYITHILESIERVESYTPANHTTFMESTMLQDAIVRNFEIIGEASKRISQELKDLHPEIPWRRDVLIHDYAGVDAHEVWNIIRNDLPDLKKNLVALLGSHGSQGG